MHGPAQVEQRRADVRIARFFGQEQNAHCLGLGAGDVNLVVEVVLVARNRENTVGRFIRPRRGGHDPAGTGGQKAAGDRFASRFPGEREILGFRLPGIGNANPA